MELVLEPITHTYTRDGVRVPGISEIIQSAGMVDDKWFTEYSRDRGSMAHLACQLHDEDDLDESTLDPVIRPYLEAWKKFRADTCFNPELIERKLYHPVYGYAGTLDRYGLFNDYKSVIELKSGLISAVTGLQLAAQGMLLEANGYEVQKRFALQIKKDGAYKLTPYNDANARVVFLACVTAHNFKTQNGIIKEA